MAITDKSVFTELTSRGDMIRIYQSCIQTGAPVMGHSERGTRFSFIARILNGITLTGDFSADREIAELESVTVLFSVGVERYLARTHFKTFDGATAIMSLDCAIFKLQRRDNFRVAVEQLKGSRFELIELNGVSRSGTLNLIDFSAGGLGAEMGLETVVPLKHNDVVKGRVLVPGFINEIVLGTVRYLKPKGSAGSPLRHVGIQFQEIPLSVQQEFSIRVLEIHREYFSRLDLSRAR